MTREEIIDGLEIYTVGRLKKARVHITVEELQKFIDAIKALEQEPCDDAISRQAAIDAIFAEPLYKAGMKKRYAEEAVPSIFERIKALPPVTPAEKVGQWIDDNDGHGTSCSECDKWYPHSYLAKREIIYCCRCGAKMQEAEE